MLGRGHRGCRLCGELLLRELCFLQLERFYLSGLLPCQLRVTKKQKLHLLPCSQRVQMSLYLPAALKQG